MLRMHRRLHSRLYLPKPNITPHPKQKKLKDTVCLSIGSCLVSGPFKVGDKVIVRDCVSIGSLENWRCHADLMLARHVELDFLTREEITSFQAPAKLPNLLRISQVLYSQRKPTHNHKRLVRDTCPESLNHQFVTAPKTLSMVSFWTL